MKSLRVLVLVLCASTFALGADPEFKGIVHSIEHTYGVHHTHIPFLGLASFFARPAGVYGFQLAVFEGFQPSTDSSDIRRVVENSLGPGWYPFVRVQSKGKHDGETTLIYTYPLRKQIAHDDRQPRTLRSRPLKNGTQRTRHRKMAEGTRRTSQRPHKPSPPRRRRLTECVGADAFVRPATLSEAKGSVPQPKFFTMPSFVQLRESP